MRVTLVTETYLPQVNGVSRTLGQLVRHLGDRGDSVQLVHPDYGLASISDRTCLVRSLTLPFYQELHLPLPPFGRVHQAIERFRPDLVHIATEATLGLSVLRLARRLRIPTVSSFHTNFDQYSDHYRVGWAKGPIWRYLRWFHNQTLETYVPSRTTIAALEARGFDRLVLWPRGVDGTLFRPDRPGRSALRQALGFAPDDLVIATVSRIAAEKNIDYLADALGRVSQARPDIRLLFVGDGPERAKLERLMGDRATFVGYRVGDDLADHYAAADLFAFASLTETFGNVILEAMASGLPVVAIRAGGVGDIVNPGVTGALVAPNALPDEFASALYPLIDDSVLRNRTSEAARAYALAQSWGAIMETLRLRYQAIVAARSPEPGRPRSLDRDLRPKEAIADS
jgi:glycosyltransferase involved in cell wall biosynthesis